MKEVVTKKARLLSPEQREALLEIYVGQNIRREGILQSETTRKDQVQELLSEGLVRENHWHLYQCLCTAMGSYIGETLVKERIKEVEEELNAQIGSIPSRVIGFFIRRFVSKDLAFSTRKPSWYDVWDDRILADDRIWIFWNHFFKTLKSHGLCVVTHDYVSTRGGELRDLCYVMSFHKEYRNFW